MIKKHVLRVQPSQFGKLTPIFAILFLFFSCKKDGNLKKNKLSNRVKYEKLNIGFAVTNYEDAEYNVYGKSLSTSRIAISNNVLLLMSDNEFDSIKQMQIWVNGKAIKTKQNFNSLKKRFKLKEISINEFVKEKNDSISSPCFSRDDFNSYSSRKLKNNLLLNFYNGNLKKDTIVFLNVCNKSTIEKIPIHYEIGAASTCLFLHDITGDGIEEVFVGYYLVNGRNNNYSVVVSNVFSFSKND